MRVVGAIAIAGALVFAAVLGTQWTRVAGEPAAQATTTEATTLTTDVVSRRTLEHAEEFTGTVGYGETFALPGQAMGTVTWVPAKGDALSPGDVLYRTDDRPTYWTKAAIPMYRSLSFGEEGEDVAQLQRYLESEGFLDAEYAISGEFDSATRSAAKEWQEARGLEKTGRIDATQLLFLPYDSLRVATAPRVGDQAAGGVLDVTLSHLFVTVDVGGGKKSVFDDATEIEVETADGTIHSAHVHSIKPRASQDEYGEQQYRVRLTLPSTTNQESGEVTVDAVDVLAADVLAVPARALIALVEGGFGVEVVVDDGTTQYRAVEIGDFADGWVEVTGNVAEGDRVVVPT